MNSYQHVLAAVGFTPEDSQVLQRAVQLAQANNADLTVLHVVEYAAIAYSGDLIMPEEVVVDQQLAEEAQKRLTALCSTLELPGAASAVVIGTPKQEIVRIAKERGVDLIVVGSHGRHGLQLLLGSTANGVLHLAECDVLAVRVRG